MPILFFFLLFLGPLAWSSSSVFAFKSIKFSDIQQCGPFNISFAGGKPPAALPLTLTVIPFNSTPISITIPDPSWNATTSTGAAVTFLPLAAGTEFIASLDDAEGQGVGSVSDFINILPSDNSSCVSTPSPTTKRFTISSNLVQCQSFDVVFNATMYVPAPSVRALIPEGQSYFLNGTQGDGTIVLPPFNLSSYQMTAPQGSQLVLLFNDSSGYRESSSLETIQGDTTSNTSCLSFFNDATGTNSQAAVSTFHLSRQAIIAITSTVGSVVTTVGILMCVYAYLHRQRHRQRINMRGIEGGPGFDYPKGLGPIPPSPPPKIVELPCRTVTYLNNPPYSFETPATSPCFIQSPPETPIPQTFEAYRISSNPNPEVGRSGQTNRKLTATSHPSERAHLSVLTDTREQGNRTVSMDIDKMLDLATMYSPTNYTRESKLLTPESPRTPYSPYSYSATSPTVASRQPEQKDKPESSPIYHLRSNCGNQWYDARGSSEIPVQHACDDNDQGHSRESGGVYIANTSYRFPDPPGRAMVKHAAGQLGAGVGVGRGRGLTRE